MSQSHTNKASITCELSPIEPMEPGIEPGRAQRKPGVLGLTCNIMSLCAKGLVKWGKQEIIVKEAGDEGGWGEDFTKPNLSLQGNQKVANMYWSSVSLFFLLRIVSSEILFRFYSWKQARTSVKVHERDANLPLIVNKLSFCWSGWVKLNHNSDVLIFSQFPCSYSYGSVCQANDFCC